MNLLQPKTSGTTNVAQKRGKCELLRFEDDVQRQYGNPRVIVDHATDGPKQEAGLFDIGLRSCMESLLGKVDDFDVFENVKVRYHG